MKLSENFVKYVGAVILLSMLTIPLTFIGSANAATQINVTIYPTQKTAANIYSLGFQLDGPDSREWINDVQLQTLSDTAGFKLVRFVENRLGNPCTSWNEATKTGTWNWANIDSLMQKIFAIGAEPLIVLGFAKFDKTGLSTLPSGMKTNPTTRLPSPSQWATYTAEWVKHFKAKGLPIRYYELVNEAYHYFGWPATQPKLGYFMNLYNAAAKAMRAANSNIKISSDCSTLKTVLAYFIKYGEPLDFISFHRYAITKNAASTSTSFAFSSAETQYLVDTTNVWGAPSAVKQYAAAKGRQLPIIMSEGNFNAVYDSRMHTMTGAVYTALSIRAYMLNKISYSVYFHFAGKTATSMGMVNIATNQPHYPYYAQQMIGQNLAVGDSLLKITSSSANLRSLAWRHSGKINVLLIAKVDTTLSVSLKGLSGTLSYKKIDNTYSWTAPRVQTGTFSSQNAITIKGYTVMLVQSSTS